MNGLLVRLAFSGIRARWLASTLTVVIAACVAATVVIALEASGTGRDPWQKTFDAANGADVIAEVASETEAIDIATLPGVTKASEPVPSGLTTLSGVGEPVGVRLTGLDGVPAVNTPVLTDGHMPGSGFVVLEQSLARALGLGIGSQINLTSVLPGQPPGTEPDADNSAAVRLTVAGTAVVPSQPRFPRSNPGLAWVGVDDLEKVQPDRSRWRWTQAVQLNEPVSAAAFADTVLDELGPGNAIVTTKDQQRADALLDTQPIVLFVTAYSLVLLAVAFAVSVILVGARAREQSREIGLLRAIGLTPPQVGRVFAIESGVLGLLGVGIGFPVGALLAPVLAGSFADTMVASPTTSADPWHAGVAAVPVVLVLVLGTWLATRRQSRRPVINALNAGSAAQGRRSRIARRAARFAISPSLDLGLRNLLAVPSRATMLGLSLVVTGAAVVFALSVKASLDAARGSGPSDVPDGLPLLVYSLDVVLVLIAALGLIAVTLLAVREQMREFGILKTLGFTPGQITLSLTGSNTLLALVAGVISLPAGMALYTIVYAAAGGPSEGRVFAPPIWQAMVVLGLVALTLAMTSLPVRLTTRAAIADALRHE